MGSNGLCHLTVSGSEYLHEVDAYFSPYGIVPRNDSGVRGWGVTGVEVAWDEAMALLFVKKDIFDMWQGKVFEDLKRLIRRMSQRAMMRERKGVQRRSSLRMFTFIT